MNPLQALGEAGQSVWLDFLDRRFLTDGGLKALIEADGVTGVTSNPTIFERAISQVDAYDDDFRALLAAKPASTAIEIYEHLAVRDIQLAADILRPVYDARHKRDGYVSLEVSPYIALDTQGTIDEARRLWSAVDRPNVMIKVPGTPAGIAAATTLIGDGLNLNVTLLFSVEVYRAVADAIMTGLEMRVARQAPIDHIASVASFFISRIDTEVEKAIVKLDTVEARSLSGKVAIANAKLAYAVYRDIVASSRWKALSAKDALPQRLLWASTGSKMPGLGDVAYVEGLVCSETVNTMAPATMKAFRDHGAVREGGVGDGLAARDCVQRANATGVDLNRIGRDLLDGGLALFSASFDDLLKAVDDKRLRFLAEAAADVR